jgi:hypothetical protein
MPRNNTKLLEYWFKYRYGQAATHVVSEPAEPWVCPGYSESPKSRRRSTVWDFVYDPVFSESATARILRQSRETLESVGPPTSSTAKMASSDIH